MSRGMQQVGRPVAVWVSVTAAATAAGLAVPGAWRSAGSATGAEAVADLLVAACATGLVLALAWLWAITTATVAGLLAGRPLRGGGVTRRLVLVACGAAVLAGTGVPALGAGGGDGAELLVGLSLPERAVAPRVRHASEPSPTPPQATGTYVVRAGDSLWSIARDHPQPTTPVDQRWRAIWQANRDVVGDDPDLIIPGQALRLPARPTTQDPTSDGDRQ